MFSLERFFTALKKAIQETSLSQTYKSRPPQMEGQL